jgi:hypothetical protein
VSHLRRRNYVSRTPQKVVFVNKDITRNTTCGSDKIWVITSEVHVRCHARLTIKPGTRVLFAQWPITGCKISVPFATLVVDSGASIVAYRVEFAARFGGWQSNGGLIIAGTLANGQFENYPTIRSFANRRPGRSRLICCTFNSLGNNAADLNALTLFNVKGSEIKLSNIAISNAGDDGLEIFGGDHEIDVLNIETTADDALDLDFDATLTVTKGLNILKNAVAKGEQNLGTSLVEVVGEENTTNTLIVKEGATVYLFGRITDKTNGTTMFTGDFAGFSAGEIIFFNETLTQDSKIIGSNP